MATHTPGVDVLPLPSALPQLRPLASLRRGLLLCRYNAVASVLSMLLLGNVENHEGDMSGVVPLDSDLELDAGVDAVVGRPVLVPRRAVAVLPPAVLLRRLLVSEGRVEIEPELAPPTIFRRLLFVELTPMRRVAQLQMERGPLDQEMAHERTSWALNDLDDPVFFPLEQHQLAEEMYRKSRLVGEANRMWGRPAPVAGDGDGAPLRPKRRVDDDDGQGKRRVVRLHGLNMTSDDFERMRLD